MIVEIVILAMIAAFLGLRLYSVLGRRAEHEEEPIPHRFDTGEDGPAPVRSTPMPAPPSLRHQPLPSDSFAPGVERGIRAIAAVDPGFDIIAFLEGAQGAYKMVLEAFWSGDRDGLAELCDSDVYASFAGAIDARDEAGHSLENRLIRIEETRIHAASLDGRMARIAVLFVADIAAVTRDANGAAIAGSLDDAVESRDIWTFSRNVDAAGPDWLLDETDEG